ncbi:Chromatin-remodelling complex [Penicillium brevicompactum]|uniref:Chromatin-remodelling complex RSC SWI/SNF subunit Rsc7/Swp82 n=1 Tax=Penicillium brevicompactum TaxID=5074 RepID=UPI0025405881|nr:Chromatin-remodelling complex RSC SWI/SNF subunit Rsc7/Swp82 [Penicillium brevicompactum]KAJ5347834.1 Chromatin-remodelling complex RSC SWI/SNF subunit Rsc7/Swp82 [Penicillium brevicompactum]
MPRKSRAAAQAAAELIKNVPVLPEGSDEEMLDAPPSHESSPVAESHHSSEHDPDSESMAQPEAADESQPQSESETKVEAEAGMEGEATTNPATDAGEKEDGEGTPATPKVEDDTSVATPAEDSILTEAAPTPTHGPGRPGIYPRGKRRIGRPPKNPRPIEYEADGETPIRVTTPAKRRRGRPAASGGRWARNRGPSHLTQVPIDKEGNMMDVINDEVSIPPDPIGATKVDENGHLQGGREYRVRTFKILGRGDRLYMLSTEPARCIGFRDSYLFFQKHKMLYKIIIDDDAKRDLIERDLIPHSYKGRAIGVVTARSVFREFGSKIIVGGKKITDDYDEAAARERGDVEGDLSVPEDRIPGPGEVYNRNQYVAWHGASSVYHNNAPSVPLAGGKPVDGKKRRAPVTDDNWMLEHARAASNFNHKIADMRRANLNGVYDVHTNIMQFPKIMQPTHARWERVPPNPEAAIASGLTTDMNSLNIDNKGSPSDEANTKATPEPTESKEATNGEIATVETTEPPTTIFPPVSAQIYNRYVVQDIVYESPQYSNMGVPGPDGDVHDIGPNGMVSVADPAHPEFMTPEILELLPPECKDALAESCAREVEWKSKWRTETQDGERVQPTKSYAWYP